MEALTLEDDYDPENSCVDFLLDDCRDVLRDVSDLDFVVTECRTMLDFRRQYILPYDQALAMMIYTYDGSDNLYNPLNKVLRERNTGNIRKLKPYLAYLMRGLASLPAVEATVCRGLPLKDLDEVVMNYTEGKEIYWRTFTSALTTIEIAKEFAFGRGVVVLCIEVRTGRSVFQYSAFPTEQEVLLFPNTCLVVTQVPTLNADGYYHAEK